jgi:hypothetical protein
VAWHTGRISGAVRDVRPLLEGRNNELAGTLKSA